LASREDKTRCKSTRSTSPSSIASPPGPELRETEDALISFMEQQQKRDRLYVRSQEELKEKFQFGRMGGVA
jgi:hypothetical protein